MTEKEIQKSILEFLKKKGIKAWPDKQGHFQHSTNTKASIGVPDIIGYLSDGTFLGIEVKTEKGKIRPEQVTFHDDALANGCMVFVARSLDDVIKRFP
jgi:hypothetical protein